MASKYPIFDSTETVVDILWDITLAFFVARLAFVYAALAVASTALLACAGHAALPFLEAWHVFTQIPLSAKSNIALVMLATTAIFIVVGLCSRLVVAYSEVPQVRRFRLAIGAVAAVYVGLGWLIAALALPAYCGATESKITSFRSKKISSCTAVGAVFVAAIALMPLLSMVLLEWPNSRYHRQQVTQGGWQAPEESSNSEKSEKKSLLPSAERDKATGTKPKTRVAEKRYQLRNASQQTEK